MERIEAMKRERRGISPTPPPPQCWAGNRIQSAFLSSNMRPFDYHVLLLLLFFVVVIVDSSLSSIDNSLFEALRSDDVIAASAALKDGANINALSPQGGQTPLMQSVLHGRVDMVRWCLENGADTTIAEKDGYTPMHGAAFQGHAPIAKLLLEHGVALRDVHSDGFEPAIRTCWGTEPRHLATLHFFLENGVPFDDIYDKCLEMTKNENIHDFLIGKWESLHGNSEEL